MPTRPENEGFQNPENSRRATVRFDACPERLLIRPNGCYRHIDFRIAVESAATGPGTQRDPLTLALVLDRSGSMSGDKLDTAKIAALAVLDRLEEQDRVAVVVFDDYIDTVQELAPVSPTTRARIRAHLERIEARGSTALHQGWLSGCQAVASDTAGGPGQGLTRCFLLTDGQANVGLTDIEQIASQAGGVRHNTGIGTSTFGIGPDYAETLLGPMAVAGGGQFHHLRNNADIARTFIGELGEILNVAARNVMIELEFGPDTQAEIISAYWSRPNAEQRLSVGIGDLLAGEERHVVVRFHFPTGQGQPGQTVRARLLWKDGKDGCATDWQETKFSYAEDRECAAESRDLQVMKWVGLHHAERAKREATRLNQAGDLRGARRRLHETARRIKEYAGEDSDLLGALCELDGLEPQMGEMRIDTLSAKQAYSEAQRRSRGQRDLR